ncbi:MAG TPA: manganese catalase family protein [Sphingomicrobium sp.]|jgi:Mn-containing catalase
MYLHVKEAAYNCIPEKPDPVYAKQLQELIGGQWGEMSVMLGYMFQAWNSRGPIKYRDMTFAIGTEEIGHVEMLATMVARLLEKSPVEAQEHAAKDSIVGAVMGGANVADVVFSSMSPQHAIVSGAGAMPVDSVGNRWTADYITASGNLLADFRFNVTAESQGRLQAARLYNMTDDPGIKDMLSYLITRDTMHQNQWIAAIAELEADGLDGTPNPLNFPEELQKQDFAYKFLNHSDGAAAADGRWAKGPSPDGKGEFEYVANPPALGPVPVLGMTDPRLYGTQPVPTPPAAS